MKAKTESAAAFLLGLKPRERLRLLKKMDERQQRSLQHHWRLWAHEGQVAPDGEWLGWLILAGRGFGKTRAGAEWVREVAEGDPAARIALVAASLGEARSVMVEGESGLLAIAPRGKRPRFLPSKRLLCWPNGAQAMLYSAAEPESLRGPQHSHARRAGPKGAVRQRIRSQDRRLAPLRRRGGGRRAAGKLAGFIGGGWIFFEPRDGMSVLNRTTGQVHRFYASWIAPSRPAAPSGGTTIDTQARSAISAILDALAGAGILPAA